MTATPSYSTLAETHLARIKENINTDIGFEIAVTSTKLPNYCSTLVTGNETNIVQPAWNKLINKINAHSMKKDNDILWADTSKNAFLCGKKPDISGFRRLGLATLFNLVWVGELKGESKIDDSAKGQIELYLELMMLNQKRSFT